MNVSFCGNNVRVYHKTAMGSLTDLLVIGNTIRASKSIKPYTMAQVLGTNDAKEFIKAYERKHNLS